jgi:hypothetical protein
MFHEAEMIFDRDPLRIYAHETMSSLRYVWPATCQLE